MKSFLLLLLLSVNSLGKNPFEVPREEIGKTGIYTVEQPGVPVHKDYEEIYRHNHVNKPQLSADKKYYKIYNKNIRFKIFVPESYNPSAPPGLIFMGLDDFTQPSKVFEENIKQSKEFLKQKNLIAVSVEMSQEVNLNGNMDFIANKFEYAVLIRRSISIIEERYKIDLDRIISFSSNSDRDGLSIAAITCPQKFKNNIFWDVTLLFHELMPRPDSIPKVSFGSTSEQIKTIEEASKNRYLFFFYKKEDNPQDKEVVKYIKRLLKKYNFSNTEFVDFNPQNLKSRNGHEELLLTVEKIDPKPFDAKQILNKAISSDKKKDFLNAFKFYKIAAAYGFKEAQEKFNSWNNELIKKSAAMLEAHKNNDFPAAYKLAMIILKKYGSENCAEAAQLLKEYSKDKKISLELKAASFLAKAEAALKQNPPPKDKIKAACEKVIKIVPGTKTAEKAQKMLDTL